MFYVLDGVLTMRLGDETHEIGPGMFVCVPPGVTHAFSNTSDAPVRFLNFNAPAGWENYMRDLGEAAKAGPLTPDVIGRVASRYDFQAVLKRSGPSAPREPSAAAASINPAVRARPEPQARLLPPPGTTVTGVGSGPRQGDVLLVCAA